MPTTIVRLLAQICFVALALTPAASAHAEGMQADVHGLVVPETLNSADRASALYLQKCASCHDHPQNNIPPRASLAYRSPEAIHYALTEGTMKPMTAGLSSQDVDALVLLLAGRPARPLPDPMAAACKTPAAPLVVAEDDWNTNGGSHTNTRFRDNGWLDADSAPRLRLAWSFGYPGGAGGPAVLGGDRVFLPAGFGFVLSLDAETGCVRSGARRRPPAR